jgi:hypothetical protein
MKRSRLQIAAWILAVVFLAAAPAGSDILNPSFETGDTSDWTTTGNASVVDDNFGVIPTDGTYQLLMSTSGGVTSEAAEAAMGMPNNKIRHIFRDHINFQGESTGWWPTQGTAVQQSFDVVAVGDLITFDWNFLTNEFDRDPAQPDFYTDFLWGYLEGPSETYEFVLAHANQPGIFSPSSSTDFSQETGYQTFEFTFTEAGSYTLTLGVYDVEDVNYFSGVVFDGFLINRVPEPNTFLLLAGGLLGLNWHARRRKVQYASI